MVDEKQTPDFDALNDRLIAEQPKGPTFGIKTNLDPKTPFEENPYAENVKTKKGSSNLKIFLSKFHDFLSHNLSYPNWIA